MVVKQTGYEWNLLEMGHLVADIGSSLPCMADIWAYETAVGMRNKTEASFVSKDVNSITDHHTQVSYFQIPTMIIERKYVIISLNSVNLYCTVDSISLPSFAVGSSTACVPEGDHALWAT